MLKMYTGIKHTIIYYLLMYEITTAFTFIYNIVNCYFIKY